MIRLQTSDALADLELIRDRNSFHDVLNRSCDALGYKSFVYFSMNTEAVLNAKLKDTFADMIHVTNIDSSWTEHYIKENYATSDPVVTDAFKARLPIVWDEGYRISTLTSDEAQMMADAHDFGIERGLAVPIHGPAGELGMLCLYSDIKGSKFTAHVTETKHDLHLLANYAHSVAQSKLRTLDTPKPIALTDREIEILRWTTDGKTAWEIGSILSISERTVNFHLQNAMVKFGVHNKTHAAAKAMSYGMLSV
ncbi:MAG: LuxR family transcriptional regulator [Rhodospirillaceae bacterium]